MTTTSRLLICAVILLGAAAAPAVGETIDNPQYKHWAQFKPGSFSVLKTESVTAGQKGVTTMTTTLKSVTADKAVVEMETVIKMGDQEMKLPTQSLDVPAKFEKPKETDAPKKEPEAKAKEGEETLEIDGKKVKTKWVMTKLKQGGVTVESKTWTSEEVPGQVVKSEVKTEGTVQSRTETLVVKFKAQKK